MQPAVLSDLVLSAGSIVPPFAPDILSYTLVTQSNSTTVTPTANQGEVTVDGVALTSGIESTAIQVGTNVAISIVVTAQNDSATQIYTVKVNPVVASLELLNANPLYDDLFGSQVVLLENGNIVVAGRGGSIGGPRRSAVQLFSPFFSSPIASIYPENTDERFKKQSVKALNNSNFLAVTIQPEVGSSSSVESVLLMDGRTGRQIGERLMTTGNSVRSATTVLSNSNYVVIQYPTLDFSAPSARLMDGNSGRQIGPTLDSFNYPISVKALGNNNFVLYSPYQDENGVSNAGSVRLINGNTGEQIGPALAGDVEDDRLGDPGITVLGNNNFVVASYLDDEGGVVDAGSVRLISGSTGVQIGAALVGDTAGDVVGFGSVRALGNDNYVVSSSRDDENGVIDAGAVRLMNGSTGGQIGATLAGDLPSDHLGSSGTIALSNNNYVVPSEDDDEGGITDAGSVRLINGSTGTQIGAALTGTTVGELLGQNSIIALGNNNNYVVASVNDDRGSVRLMNGSTGAQIGTKLTGYASYDNYVSDKKRPDGLTALGNSNYVVASTYDSVGGIQRSGSVRLVSGTTGLQIGTTLAGDEDSDHVGGGSVTSLENSNYVVVSPIENTGGIANAGTVRLMNGSSGEQIGAEIAGTATLDFFSSNYLDGDTEVIPLPDTNGYILVAPHADKFGLYNSGKVLIVVP